jgi:hypothetical protein
METEMTTIDTSQPEAVRDAFRAAEEHRLRAEYLRAGARLLETLDALDEADVTVPWLVGQDTTPAELRSMANDRARASLRLARQGAQLEDMSAGSGVR